MSQKWKKKADNRNSYTLYQSMGLKTFNIFKKFQKTDIDISKKEDVQKIWDLCIRFGMENSQNFLTSVDNSVLCSESEWADAGFKTIFVEDKKLVKSLFDAKYEGANPEAIELPVKGNFVSFVFPNGIEIQGVKLESCLFGIYKEGDYIEKMRSKAQKLTGDYVGKIKLLEDETTVVNLIVSNCEGPFPIHSKLKFPIFDLIKALDEEWLADFSKKDSGLKKEWRCPWDIDLTPEDVHKMGVYLRVCLGLCLYMSVLPETLKKGLPEDCKKIQEPKYHYSPSTVVLHKEAILRSGPRMHFRCSHYRTLKDSKFHRNEDGSYRQVLVRSTIVGLGENKMESSVITCCRENLSSR